MKGKIPRIVMVVVALAMAMSLVAGVTTAVGADKPGVDERWTGFTLPSEVGYQLFPGTEVGPLVLADDGTLIAGVYDETFNRWGSPRGTVFAAVFLSHDGGYNWSFGWELPEDDPGPIVDIVAAPDYEHPGTIYLATMTYLYYSEDGGENFYRTFSVCPGVAGDPTVGLLGGIITSLDVTIDAESDEYVAVVGTSWGQLDGVYTWNLGGVPIWQDMELGNRIAAAWDTGLEGVLEVAFSPNYPDDRVIYAVANYDPCIITPPWTGPSDFTTVITVYDGTAGTWGIQYMDAAIWTVYAGGPPSGPLAVGAPSTWARMAFFDDYDISSSPYCVVAVSGTPTMGALGPVDDVYVIKSLPPAVGPSSVTAMDLVLGGSVPAPFASIDAYGMYMLTGTVLVGVEFPPGSGQAQVFKGTSPAVFPQWEPSMKPPSGGMGMWNAGSGAWTWTGVAWVVNLAVQPFPGGIYVVTDGSEFFVSTGENWGMSPSGVSVGRQNMIEKFIWNGVGLIDTIVVTTDILGWTNYAAVVFEEVSPHWAVGTEGDQTLYITTWKQGWDDAFVFGELDDPADHIKGWFMFAIGADTGDVDGIFVGYYDDGNCTVPLSGTLNGSASTGSGWSSAQGDFTFCAGDPIGACCNGSWSVDFTDVPGHPCDSVAGSFDFGIDCDANCVCALTVDVYGACVGEVAVTGRICPHAYGIDIWRNAPTGRELSPEQAIVWERIGYENLVFPLEATLPWKMVTGIPAAVSAEWFLADGFIDLDYFATVVPRVHDGFEFDSDMDADEFVFLLAGVGVWLQTNPMMAPDPITNPVIRQGYTDMLLFSFDGGESVYYCSVMPEGALRTGLAGTSGPGICDVAWDVADDSTIILTDIDGYVYKTVNRGNSWTDGVDTAWGLPTDLNVSPIYDEEGGEGTDLSVLVGLWNYNASAGQVWLTQDGAEEQFVQVGKDIVDDVSSGLSSPDKYPSKVVTNFDLNWGPASNRFIYAGVSGFLAGYCCGCEAPAAICESGDAGVYRTEVNVVNPSDSIWELIYGLDDLIEEDLLPDAHPCSDRIWAFTDLEYQSRIGDAGEDATIYIPFGIFEWWPPYTVEAEVDLDIDGRLQFALGGALRTLDGTKERVEWIGWDVLTLGLPRTPAVGLWLIRPVEGTNYLFSIPCQFDVMWNGGYEIADYDVGLVIYEDTLCEEGPELTSPADDATNVGEMVGEEVNLILDWEAVESTATVTYEVQLDADGKFNASEAFSGVLYLEGPEAMGLVKWATTTETFAGFADLENAFTYFWRVRVIDPAKSPWSDVRSFTTTISGEVAAPNLESPTAGADNVALRPTFEWSALGWADTYALEVATDNAFSDVVIDESLNAQAYQPASDLTKNTTYYWRVKATSDTAESEWSATGTFTTGPDAVPGAGTPAWVWVVIVIGAILAIAVIVLIVRTRRPV